MSNSARLHRRQPTRLPRPWDSPDENTGVSCHFLLQCMKVKSEREVAESCPILSDPMDCSPPGSSVHRIFQARVLEWGAIAFFDRFNVIPIKIPMAFFTEIEQAILKCVWKHNISQIVNAILRKRIKMETSHSLISNYGYSNQSYSDQNSMVLA